MSCVMFEQVTLDGMCSFSCTLVVFSEVLQVKDAMTTVNANLYKCLAGVVSAECTETIILQTFLLWLSFLFFAPGKSGLFQFITRPPEWCWGRCFPVKCNFQPLRWVCLLPCIQDYKTGKQISWESSLILLRGGGAEDTQGLSLAQVCGAREGDSMEDMQCYSGLRWLALVNCPVHGAVYHPV